MKTVLIACCSRTGLGPFMLKEAVIPTNEGIHACQFYGRQLATML